MGIFNKLVHKLHLSELAYILESWKKKKDNKALYQTVDQALNYLHGMSPNVGQACITDRLLPPSDCDLEVIVPCYNVERYVGECVDSILAQETKYNFFVTIINDGSKDRTREILRKYESFCNVRIIDQENCGHSGARNAGLAQVHGRYVLFVDSDDILLPGAIDALMSLAVENNADVVDSGHIRFADSSRTGIMTRIQSCLYDVLQRPQLFPFNLSSPRITGYPWGKVLKSELFHKVQFPKGYWFEDTLVWMILEPLCNRKVTSDRLTFRYRMNLNSISHKAALNPKSIDTLYVTLQLLKDRESLGIQFDQYQYELLLQQMRNNFCRVQFLNTEIKPAVFVVEQDLIANKFAIWSTTNPKVKPIEDLLRAGDYVDFELWCKWH